MVDYQDITLSISQCLVDRWTVDWSLLLNLLGPDFTCCKREIVYFTEGWRPVGNPYLIWLFYQDGLPGNGCCMCYSYLEPQVKTECQMGTKIEWADLQTYYLWPSWLFWPYCMNTSEAIDCPPINGILQLCVILTAESIGPSLFLSLSQVWSWVALDC